MGLLCINCGSPVNALFIQYSPGNISLTKCAKCKAVADEYIECEIMILLIDLILHKTKAFRHLFFNLLHLNKYGLQVVLNPSKLHSELSRSDLSMWIATGKIMANTVLSNLLFFCILFIMVNSFKSKKENFENSYMEVSMAILFSSYFKIFILAMMVWDFPSLTVYITDIFVMSSNAVALRVITNSRMLESIGTSFICHLAKLLTQHMG
ncbi:protein ARV 2 isoform X2 [Cryptomeria japonica]|uniref:protein ARV 2 isoform X2 n=1 Tax=Cryptomeria japonica TaxID=3369 RepID=UPI0025AC0813|nr:protein ARV 2 isoform X2 [Cryptomeria japonica]